MSGFALNQKVRVVRTHWLRPNEIGKIIGMNENSNRWLVEFARAFPGGGIDGKMLYLEENQIEPRVVLSRR